MIVIFTPKGGEPQHYDATSLRVSEAAIVQRTVDMKWQEILGGLEQDDLDAMRGIVWVIKKRTEPSLRWSDFDPGVLELTSRMDEGEMERWITAMVTASDADLPWETVRGFIDSRIDEVAVDPERARTVLAAQEPSPKAEAPEEGSDQQAVTETGGDSSPSPTLPGPETPTSDSSPTSSTSRRRKSTASRPATSTT